jgi:hypothetical protein
MEMEGDPEVDRVNGAGGGLLTGSRFFCFYLPREAGFVRGE